MADDTTTFTEAQAQAGREGGGRGPGNREPGGFRIRLSDNEMRAARAVQEAFRLRSTVAALGFSIRTVAQLLEEGKLDELVAQQRSQAGNRGEGPRGGRRPDGRGEFRGGEGRPERRGERGPRVDPFARPARPAPAAVAAEEEAPLPIPEADADGAASAEVSMAEPAGDADSAAGSGADADAALGEA
jgi:hypothetical protein